MNRENMSHHKRSETVSLLNVDLFQKFPKEVERLFEFVLCR